MYQLKKNVIHYTDEILKMVIKKLYNLFIKMFFIKMRGDDLGKKSTKNIFKIWPFVIPYGNKMSSLKCFYDLSCFPFFP